MDSMEAVGDVMVKVEGVLSFVGQQKKFIISARIE